ncbi:hypothetical protein BASA83_011010 [Batrachochytrium salamandrivorans]|nr:hypothetical protein BASA83_011010 [Batrachochytrium salamandrivorans]
MSTKKLTRRQARWSLELSEYDFSLPIGLENLMDGRMHSPDKVIITWRMTAPTLNGFLIQNRSSTCSHLFRDGLACDRAQRGPAKSLCLGIRLAFDNCRLLSWRR